MKKILIFFIMLVIFSMISCSTEANVPKLLGIKIDGNYVVADSIQKLSYRSKKLNQKLNIEIDNSIESGIGETKNIEIIVENVERDSFVDLVVFDSKLNTLVVYNEGNGQFVCSTTTIYENNVWVTYISIPYVLDSLSLNSIIFEIREINFMRELTNQVSADIPEDSVSEVVFDIVGIYELIKQIEITDTYSIYITLDSSYIETGQVGTYDPYIKDFRVLIDINSDPEIGNSIYANYRFDIQNIIGVELWNFIFSNETTNHIMIINYGETSIYIPNGYSYDEITAIRDYFHVNLYYGGDASDLNGTIIGDNITVNANSEPQN